MYKEENINITLKIEKPEGEKELTKAEMRKSIISFTWPCMAELMLVSLISIVNLSMVGHLGSYAISAVGLTNQPLFICIAVFQAFNVGATALVARFMGSKEHDKAKEVVIQTMIVSVVAGFLLSIMGFIFSKQIVLAMGANEDTLIYAELYMKYIAVGVFFQAIPTAVSSILRGAGDTKTPMRYNIISNIVNVTAGYVLIYGFWFIPGLGIRGAAIATTLAKVTTCVLSIIAILGSNLPIAISLRDKFRLDFNMLKRIMNIGFAAAGEQFALRVGFLIYTIVIADLGTIPFASHQVTNSVSGLAFNFGQALSMAATSFMGRNLGSNRPDLAEAYGKELRSIGMIISIFLSICLFFGGYPIAWIFTDEIEVVAVTAYLLRIYVLMVPAQNSQLILAGGLRGAGDTMWPLWSAVLGVLLIRVPLVLIFIKVFHLGVGSAWVAGVIDQYIRSTVVLLRFRSGKWKQIKV